MQHSDPRLQGGGNPGVDAEVPGSASAARSPAGGAATAGGPPALLLPPPLDLLPPQGSPGAGTTTPPNAVRQHFSDWNRKFRTFAAWTNLYVGFKAAQVRARSIKSESASQLFWAKRHSRFAQTVWENIADLKGWWVKLGQFMSTRSDLLPAEYIRHLSKLQDSMPTSNFEACKAVIEEDLGCPIPHLFTSFEEKPIASASIAQVHIAHLRDGTPLGQKVVVKVQHPDVEKLLSQDMRNLAQLTWAFGMVEKGVNLGPILDEWQRQAGLELDFRQELVHQERALAGVRRSGLDVKVPVPYPEYTRRRVMVMEYCEGVKITDIEKLDALGANRTELLTKICESFAHQIHIDGMFNGDPHPGNILVQVDKTTGSTRPVLLDWGLVKTFEPPEKTAFSKMVYCVGSMDVMGLMQAFEELGFRFRSDVDYDPEVYMDALRIAFRDSDVQNEQDNAVADAAFGNSDADGPSRKELMERKYVYKYKYK
eukprot:GHVU01067546.1.p1 GENE.GHVU01067546.1~~GHVU01067546.1.p1  ORF type:complete len:482 (+),score=93.12 GHVU01067546.1:782-2227(+)